MNIQSLSVVVPNKKCINSCKFCVSRIHCDEYKVSKDILPELVYERDFINRLEFARDNGCNTLILTGTSEPQQNKQFLRQFSQANRNLPNPFKCIEMQTTGVLLDLKYLRWLREYVGVTTISLSINSFNSDINCYIIGVPSGLEFNLNKLTSDIKSLGFTLRLSLNMNMEFYYPDSSDRVMDFGFDRLITECINLNADQVTLRKLYVSSSTTSQGKWVESNRLPDSKFTQYYESLVYFGTKLGILEYGQTKYDYQGLSIVVDDDCMAKNTSKESYKYLILREDNKLYSQWDSKASLIF